ncbi:MAG: isoleucine--tRNA ligase [Proteobacteria bacterium]|nr:isoleucine--tRNA ligase [Pseudomonadota bacterium]MDA1132486.1 isoleucine--tRNA ligase [Pseudomonadota bacterium]
MSSDYRSTVFLPNTGFPMKARLPEREPEMLARWARMDLPARLREDGNGRPPFILHDGPPYANGNIHIGHALNKILKDVINRARQMTGHNSVYVPGWDCHGLPIEWQVEQNYRKDGRDKDDVPVLEFREECRRFAAHWIEVQSAEFQRLGIVGDWDNPYTTMSFAAEAQIVRELQKFLMNGGLYRGAKPVMWSPVEKTALSDAEVEYHDHESTFVFVRFAVREGPDSIKGASIVIWTTTPWTLAGNRAVAVAPDKTYVRVRVTAANPGSLAVPGEEFWVAAPLLDSVQKEVGITACEVVAELAGDEIAGAVLAHPWAGQGYDFDVPVLPAHFVEMETGTGFVHIAPGHGEDDFVLGQQHGIEVPFTVNEAGVYFDHVPMFAGRHVYKVADEVCEALREAGALLASGKLVHSYPHSWRSKAPLIFRTTPQWFISMDTNDLRAKALRAIAEVRWFPAAGQNRIYAMVASRPAWVVSRQRSWGVPLTLFVDRETGEPLRDEAVNTRISDAIEAEGGDAWYGSPPERFLGDLDPARYEQVKDTLDVWFDSGSTHAFVLEARPELTSPASLYLEGSDQHRGWFHTSLLESCGTRGRAPYREVLTHGFVMDGAGRKMSKSLGNVVAPQEVIEQFGADILRLWVVSSDYSEDLRIGPEILRAQVDSYRRLRNTLRYILANLEGFDDSERLAVADMPELERFVLHRVAGLDDLVRSCCAEYDFHRLFVALHGFCAVDLSSFYFDIRKDALYCDPATSRRRRAARTVLAELFSRLTAWLAPILVFTAEEAWLERHPGDDQSVHLRQFPETPGDWRDDALAARWDDIRALRRAVTAALEVERREKRIGSSLQAHAHVYGAGGFGDALGDVDFAAICITSGITLADGDAPAGAFTLDSAPGIAVVITAADGDKCERCWRVLAEVADHGDLCHRCADAVAAHP